MKDKLQAAEEEKAMMEAHWLEEIKKLKAEHERHAAQLREETRKAQVQTKKAEEAVVHRRNSEIAAAIQHSMHQQHSETPPSPPPLPAPSPPTAPPAFTAMTSIASIEEPKAITMTSRFTSPKRTHDGGGAVNQQQSRQNKTYVNMYAVADEVTTANAPPPKGRTSSSGHGHGHGQAPKLYNAFSYSAELKEDGPLSSVSKKESPQPWVGGQYYGASSGGFTPSHNISSGGSVNGSISSRREELIDPEDENQEPIPVARFTPPIYPQQNAPNGGQHRPASQQSSYGSQVVQPADSSGMKNSFSAPNLSAQQLSLRMKRLPQSGTSSPMTPLTISSQGTSFSPGPSPNPNGLQVPRSLMKSSSIRGMIQKQNSATAGKVAGPYMAPHGVAYTVASSAESTPREAPATPSSVSSTAGKNFMSSTKAVKINQQLLQESAKEKFMKKFTFNKTGI